MATAMNEINLAEAVRPDFKILEKRINGLDLVYLDNAATSLKPNAVLEAVIDYYENCTANIHRGCHFLSEVASDKYEIARHQIALFVGASSNEVLFLRNTTEALNFSLWAAEVSSKDLVVGFIDSHHSNTLPWMRSGNFHAVTINHNFEVDLNHYQELLRHRPKVVVITHCSNVTGSVQSLGLLVGLAKEAGALVVIDAAQSIAHMPINFSEIDCDFLAFSSHKMLGPSGIGCLIAKAKHLESLAPQILGGGTVDYVQSDGFTLRKSPHRFEAGTPAIEASFGLAAAVDYINSIGFESIRRHEELLCEVFFKEIKRIGRVHILGNTNTANRAPIFSMWIDGIKNLKSVTRSLSDSFGIMSRNGHLCSQPLVDAFTDGEVLRASAYIYNTPEELRYFVGALEKTLKLF